MKHGRGFLLLHLVQNPDWSPNGDQLLYQSSLDDTTSNYYKNSKIFRLDANGDNVVRLASNLDENIYGLRWNDKGIYGIAWQKTDRHLVKINPTDGSHSIRKFQDKRVWSYAFDSDEEVIDTQAVALN